MRDNIFLVTGATDKQGGAIPQRYMRNTILIFLLLLTTLTSYGQKNKSMKQQKITHFEDTVSINSPIEAVFSYLTDFHNTAKWHKGMVKVGWKDEEPHGVGSEYDWTERNYGMKMDIAGVITAWNPPYSFNWKPNKSPFPITGGWTLEEKDNSILVTRFTDFQLSGVYKFFNWLMLPLSKRQIRKELQELKRLIETGNTTQN